MPNTMFMRVEDVAEEMGVSVSYAYKLIRKLNKELKATGALLSRAELIVNSFTRNSILQKQLTKGTTDNGSI